MEPSPSYPAPSPRPPSPPPASLPPLPEDETQVRQEEQQVDQSDEQQQQQQQQTAPSPAPRAATPPAPQPRTIVPPSLPVLRRSSPSDWDVGELRTRYRALEDRCTTLQATVQEKEEDIRQKEEDNVLLMRKTLKEAAEREQAQALVDKVARHGARLEEEMWLLRPTTERLQRRVRQLRADRFRMKEELGALRRQQKESASAVGNARRALDASGKRIHVLEERRMRSEQEALQLQSKAMELERALEEARQGREEAERKAAEATQRAAAPAAAREQRPPPTVSMPHEPQSGSMDAALDRILQENLRLQEELQRTRAPLPSKEPSIPETEASTPPATSPFRTWPSPSSSILGGYPRGDSTKRSSHLHRVAQAAAAKSLRDKQPHVRLYGFDSTRVREAIVAARAEAQRVGLGERKPLSWGEASSILRHLDLHRRRPPTQLPFSALGVLDCIQRNSTVDQPTPVVRAFLRSVGE